MTFMFGMLLTSPTGISAASLKFLLCLNVLRRYRKGSFIMCSSLPGKKLTSGKRMQRDRSVPCQGCRQTAQDHLGPSWQLSKHSWLYGPQNILGRAPRPSSNLLLRVKPLCEKKHLIFSGAALQSKWQARLFWDHNAA
uniref:Secreted protein n=1 Tax=Molossus molossus TaxID=27622 RepID=A0A7J8IZV7_MOLMO|nr:hypothetical protein HJG59_010313 [Molossus molossus]